MDTQSRTSLFGILLIISFFVAGANSALADAATEWAKFPLPRITAFRSLFNAGEYHELDRLLRGYQDGVKSGKHSEGQVLAVFEAFKGYRPEKTDKFDEWVRAMPNSYAALVARGMHHDYLGWQARGNKYIKETPSNQLRRMHHQFNNAKRDFLEALTLNPRLTAPYPSLIWIAMAQGLSTDKIRYFEEGLKRSPGSFEIYESYLLSLVPQWGGTVTKINTVLDRIRTQMSDYPKLSSHLGFPYSLQATFLERQEKYEEIEDLYDKALSYGYHQGYYYGRLRARLSLHKFKDALDDVNMLLAYRPFNIWSLSVRAALRLRSGVIDSTKIDLDLAVEIYPDQVGEIEKMGMKAYRLKNYELASLYLDLAVYGGADNRQLRYSRIVIRQMKDGLFDPALAGVEAGATEDDENPSTWFTLGSMLRDREEDCRGIKAFRTFLRRCDETGHRICRPDVRKSANEMIDEMVAATKCPE